MTENLPPESEARNDNDGTHSAAPEPGLQSPKALFTTIHAFVTLV